MTVGNIPPPHRRTRVASARTFPDGTNTVEQCGMTFVHAGITWLAGIEIDSVISRTGSMDGLPRLLGDFEIVRTFMAAQPAPTSACQEWMNGLHSRSIPVEITQTGLAYDLSGGARLEVVSIHLAPAMLALTYGSVCFLFGPEMTTESSGLLAAKGKVNVAI